MIRWISSDWHLGEDRIDLMMRPFKISEEMTEVLIERHNSLVKPDDLVYVNGDVCCQVENLSDVSRFNGRKILIRGNHDRIFTDDQLKGYFEEVIAEGEGIELEVGNIPTFITHYPSQARKDRFNLVGHVHSAWKVQLNMLNTSVDVHNFGPANLDEIVPFIHKAICGFYDDDIWAAYMPANQQFVGKRGRKSVYFS